MLENNMLSTYHHQKGYRTLLGTNTRPLGGVSNPFNQKATAPEGLLQSEGQNRRPQQKAMTEGPPDGYCCGRYASYWNAFLS